MSGERPDGFYMVRPTAMSRWLPAEVSGGDIFVLYSASPGGRAGYKQTVSEWGERIPDNDTLRRQRERLERLSESDPVEALSQLLEESGLEARLDATAWLRSFDKQMPSAATESATCTECGAECDGGWGKQCSRSCARAATEDSSVTLCPSDEELADICGVVFDPEHDHALEERRAAFMAGAAWARRAEGGGVACREHEEEDRSQPPPGYEVFRAEDPDPDWPWMWSSRPSDPDEPLNHASSQHDATLAAWEHHDAIAKPAYERGRTDGAMSRDHQVARILKRALAAEARADLGDAQLLRDLFDARAGNAQLHDELAQIKSELEAANRKILSLNNQLRSR